MNTRIIKIYKEKDVAMMLGLSRATLYRLRSAGVIKARRLPGRRIGYLPSEIDEYVNSLPTTLDD